ncbi:hypothetical protein J6590_093154 [Homalodisca vitripennis]|nr:hypothetical protein J6590_093154 [Homalodisca vitripennis]
MTSVSAVYYLRGLIFPFLTFCLSVHTYSQEEEASSLQHHGNTSDTVTTASLTVELSSARFPGGKLRLRCVADLFSISRTVRELWLDEDRPRLASVLGNKNSAAAGASSFTCLLQMALMAAVIHSR